MEVVTAKPTKITPTRVKIRVFGANLLSRSSHLAGPFSLGEGMFILPITPTPLDKFPAHFTGGEVYGRGPRSNSAQTRKLNEPHANAQEMRRTETNQGCGQPPRNQINQGLSVPSSTVSAKVRPPRRSGGTSRVDDLLKRNFTASRVNEKWLQEITRHSTSSGKLYLCAIMDCSSRRIVGYSIYMIVEVTKRDRPRRSSLVRVVDIPM
jgi:hypothetical protein